MPVPEALTDVHAALGSLPLAVLFVVTLLAVALETSLFIGLLVPGDVVVLVVATTATTPARFGAVAAAALVGSLLGESVGYAIGRRFGPAIRGSRLGRRLGERRWEEATRTVDQWGPRAILLARFTPVVHAMLPVVAATVRYPFRRFIAWCAVASAAWSVVYTGVGAVAGTQLTRVKSALGLLGVGALLAFGVLLVSKLGHAHLRRLETNPHGGVHQGPSAPSGDVAAPSTGATPSTEGKAESFGVLQGLETARGDVSTTVAAGTDETRDDGSWAGRMNGDAVMVHTSVAVGADAGIPTRGSSVRVAPRRAASSSFAVTDESRRAGTRAATWTPGTGERDSSSAAGPRVSTGAPAAGVRLAWRAQHVLVLAVVAVLVGFLAYQNRDAIDPRAWRENLHVGWMTLAVVGVAATLVGNTWNLMGASPVRLRFGSTFVVQVAGSLLRVVSPAAVGGAAVNVQHLRRVGLGDVAAVGTVSVAQAMQFLLTLVLLPPIAFAAGTDVRLLGGDGVRIALYVVAAFAVVAGVAVIVVRRSPGLAARVRVLLGELTRSLRAMAADPRRAAVSMGGAVLVSAGLAISLWASVHAFGGSLSPFTAFGVLLLGSTAGNAVPVPGGLGSVEAALVAALTATGTALTVALPAVALFRLVTLWLLLPAGLVSVGVLRRRRQL